MRYTFTASQVTSAYYSRDNKGAEAFRMQIGDVAEGDVIIGIWLYCRLRRTGAWGYLDTSRGGKLEDSIVVVPPPPTIPTGTYPPPADNSNIDISFNIVDGKLTNVMYNGKSYLIP